MMDFSYIYHQIIITYLLRGPDWTIIKSIELSTGGSHFVLAVEISKIKNRIGQGAGWQFST